MARRLRLRSAGHPTDATMGSTVSAALGYRCSLPQDEATRGGHHRFVLLTNQRTLVREELVGRTDHQRHGRVRALGVVTAAAGAIRAGGDHSRPPSPAWTCTSSDTSRSARRAASTTPSEASGPLRRRAGLMQHSGDRQSRLFRHAGGQQSRAGRPRLRSTSTPTASDSRVATGPARVGRGFAAPTRVRGGPLGDGTPPSRAPPRAHITTTTTHHRRHHQHRHRHRHRQLTARPPITEAGGRHAAAHRRGLVRRDVTGGQRMA